MSLGLNNLIIIGNLSAIDANYKATMNAMYSAPLAIQIVCLAVLVPSVKNMYSEDCSSEEWKGKAHLCMRWSIHPSYLAYCM